MTHWKVILGLLILACLAATGVWAVRLAGHAGAFLTLEETGTEQCRVVKSPPGTEDIAADREAGWVYLSATDRRANGLGRGDVYALRLDTLDQGIENLSAGLLEGFQPHGISLWLPGDGTPKHLFAISHPPEGDSRVEIFRIEEDGAAPRLVHLETITDPLIRTPNDLAAVGPRSFYLTNDHLYVPGDPRRFSETFLRLNSTDLVYMDRNVVQVADANLTYANGITVTPDGGMVFVSETTDSRIRVYIREVDTGILHLLRTIPVGPGPDNLDIDENGTLWLASHPKLFRFLAHSRNAEELSPTRVQRIDLTRGTGKANVEDVLLDEGDQLSGGSVAVRVGETLLVGSVFESQILVCSLATGETESDDAP